MSKTLDEIINSPSLVRQSWLPTDVAKGEVIAFEQRFGTKHLMLACHAALPSILSPELVNLIHLNFLEGENITWEAEVDFLLSSLCRPLDEGLYEVEPSIREVLLVKLEDNFGLERPFYLAKFLKYYLANKVGLKLRSEFVQTQRWIAQAYIDPDILVQEMTKILEGSLDNDSLPLQIEIVNNLELLGDTLEGTNKLEEYQYLVNNLRVLAQLVYEDEQKLESESIEQNLRLLSPFIQKKWKILNWKPEKTALINYADLRDGNNRSATVTEPKENIWSKGFSYIRNLIRPKDSNIPLDILGNSEIRIIGHRGAGKTTFMAALSYFSHVSIDNPIQSIEPFNTETTHLINQAQDILMQGLTLPPTLAEQSANMLPLYEILITLKPRFFSNPIATLRKQNIRLSVSEYPGELMEDLSLSYERFSLSNYLDDCASTLSLMLLIDPFSFRQDHKYALGFQRLSIELEQRLVQQNAELSNYRIAVVFSKCELPEIYINRHLPKSIILRYFPQTYRCLREWETQWSCSLAYFACSAFGIYGDRYPIPNVKVIEEDNRGTQSIIANPKSWKPFGLVAPIYWLYTGKHDPRLENF